MENDKKSNNFINVYNKINGPIGFTASIITIVLSFLTEKNNIVRIVFLFITFLSLLSFIGYAVKSIFDTSRAKRSIEESNFRKNINLAGLMHKYIHNVRTFTSQMYYINRNSVSDKAHIICDLIVEYYELLLSDYINDERVAVCIKTINSELLLDTDQLKWEMETLARSTSTKQDRCNFDGKSVKISENNDFKIIISPDYPDELFASPDMSNIEADFMSEYGIPYSNSRRDFHRYYASTIVVPIKMNGKNFTYTTHLTDKFGKMGGDNLILGFLCIDSTKAFTTDDEIEAFKCGIEYAKSFADSLYLFFEKVLTIELSRTQKNKGIKK